MSFTLERLEALIRARAGADAENSYTKTLLEAGVARAGKKLGEEAVEAVIAAVEGDKAAFAGEAADVLYHLLVVCRLLDVSVQDILALLEARTARSGHAEKASRVG